MRGKCFEGVKTLKTVSDCINGFMVAVENRKNVNYANRAPVRKYNLAYDKCYRNLKFINDHYPDQLDVLETLLDHPDPVVVRTCAAIISRLTNCKIDLQIKAIQVYKNLLDDPNTDAADRFAYTIFIADWEENLSEL
jgi:hypothetical protein